MRADKLIFTSNQLKQPKSIYRATLFAGCSQVVDRMAVNHVDINSGVLITGFWRSGTTWLQQMLGSLLHAKTIFEPLDARVLDKLKYYSYPVSINEKLGDRKVFMPYCIGKMREDTPLYKLIHSALLGDIEGRWVRRSRRSITESFRHRVVVKLVRGQLCLNAIAGSFQIPVIHIYRDPRAVLASILRADWGKGWLDELSLRKQLLSPADGRSVFFNKFDEAIDYYDSKGKVERISAYWALTEIFVRWQLEQCSSNVVTVRYETLRKDPERILSHLLEKLKLDPVVSLKDFHQEIDNPSSTAGPKRGESTARKRMSGWKSELDNKTISTIDSVVRVFDMDRIGC